MKEKLLLIGGGGHCHSVIDSILSLNEFDEIGIIDNINTSYLGISVIGKDEDLPLLYKDGWHKAIITVGSIGDTKNRRRLFESIKNIGISLQTIIDPTSVLAKDVYLGHGVFVGKSVVINAGARIGDCSIINTASIIEHDCIIGDFVHISPGSVLCGQVNVGNDSHIGAGSCVKQLLNIGEKTIIGIGSNVTNDIPSNVVAFGSPCKVVK